jgi:acyl-CoA reductase-like NAD-dependent aldehyde dehydrogenase
MEAAAKHLTPMTLELGGKSPCIILPDADIDVAARRIVWGKFFNAGQTCVAPDYLLIPPIMKNRFLEKMKETLVEFFGDDPINSPDFARIIDAKNVTRLKGLLGSGTVFVGGEVNEKERYIAPTILDKVSLEDPVMQEEIFGPILPVLDYQELQGAIQMIRKLPRPLALYIFTKDREYQERVLNELSFGGGCVNDTLLQFDNPRLPIGGVGDSGMGHYHGKYSFDTFSKKKGVVKKPFFMDIKFRYPPYDKKLELFLKLKKRPSFSEED